MKYLVTLAVVVLATLPVVAQDGHSLTVGAYEEIVVPAPGGGFQTMLSNLPGVRISIENRNDSSIRRVATTGTDGRVVFGDLPVGDYSITLQKSGYRLANRKYRMPAYDAITNIEMTRNTRRPVVITPPRGR